MQHNFRSASVQKTVDRYTLRAYKRDKVYRDALHEWQSVATKEQLLWTRHAACSYDRRSWGSRSGGTTTASKKEEGNISIRSRCRVSPQIWVLSLIFLDGL